jgi:hypothetical protein
VSEKESERRDEGVKEREGGGGVECWVLSAESSKVCEQREKDEEEERKGRRERKREREGKKGKNQKCESTTR